MKGFTLHSQTQKANSPNSNKQLSPFKNNIFTMLAAFTGVVFGVLGSLGFVTSYIHSQLADQTASLSHVLSLRNADLTTQCSAPAGGAGGSGGAAVKTASASTPAGGQGAGGMGGGAGGGGSTFVHKLVNGVFSASGTISNTGAGSSNSVATTQTATMTVHNENNLSATNVNPQGAFSGSATANQNTTGGAANSGVASNENNTSFDYSVNN